MVDRVPTFLPWQAAACCMKGKQASPNMYSPLHVLYVCMVYSKSMMYSLGSLLVGVYTTQLFDPLQYNTMYQVRCNDHIYICILYYVCVRQVYLCTCLLVLCGVDNVVHTMLDCRWRPGRFVTACCMDRQPELCLATFVRTETHLPLIGWTEHGGSVYWNLLYTVVFVQQMCICEQM